MCGFIIFLLLFIICKEIMMASVSLFGSNYDRWYYWLQYRVPTDSPPDPEEHAYGPKDPHTLPYWGE